MPTQKKEIQNSRFIRHQQLPKFRQILSTLAPLLPNDYKVRSASSEKAKTVISISVNGSCTFSGSTIYSLTRFVVLTLEFFSSSLCRTLRLNKTRSADNSQFALTLLEVIEQVEQPLRLSASA